MSHATPVQVAPERAGLTPPTPGHPVPGASVMDRLRDSTSENHKAAERHPLQAALATGRLPRDRFVLQHAQLYLVHAALEAALMRHAATVPAIASVVKLYQISAPYLAADMLVFGIDPAQITPTPATRATIARIEAIAAHDPVALLGMQYVLEGSKNGAKFLCKVVMKAYELAPGQGCLYMDPYGPNQRAYWQRFKDDMNAIAFTEEQTVAMIASAGEMFDAIAAIGTDVLAA